MGSVAFLLASLILFALFIADISSSCFYYVSDCLR